MKKLLLVFVFLFAVWFALPSSVKAVTIAELQAQIQVLMLQLQLMLQQQGIGTNLGTGAATWCYTFNSNLKIGSTGADFDALVTALDKEGIMEFISTNKPKEYNEAIAGGVSAFQQKYASEILTPNGLKYPTGYVGPSTRKKLNALYKCVPTPNCSTLWWSDNTNKTCASQKQFCGVYLYYGLQTFSTQQACLNANQTCGVDSDCPQVTCVMANCPVFKCVNGKCTSSSTTCAENGKKVYGSEVFGPMQCCSNNAGIKPSLTQSGDYCIAPTDGSKGTCVENWSQSCGNGKCETGEDKCNCPNDCLTATINYPNCIIENGTGTKKTGENSKCCYGLEEQDYAETNSYPSTIVYRCIKPSISCKVDNDCLVICRSCIPGFGVTCAQGCVQQKCSDGKCVASTPTTTCTDSDGGKNYSVRGTLGGICSNAPCGMWADSCQDTNSLIEYFCDGTNYNTNFELHRCPNGCLNGACK